MPRLNSAADLEKLRQKILAKSDGKKRVVSVTNGTDGRTRHSQDIVKNFIDEIKKQGLTGKVIVKSTGCHGFCEKEPTALILPEEICYVSLKPEDVPEIVSETLVGGRIVERLLYEDPTTKQKIAKESEIPFYKYQSQALLGNNRFIDPRSIEDYIALGGYDALAKALFKLTPEEVLEEIKTDPKLKSIPVVILTSSKAEQDIVKTYNLHANCYITKPVDLDQFISVIKSIEDFWLTVVRLP